MDKKCSNWNITLFNLIQFKIIKESFQRIIIMNKKW